MRGNHLQGAVGQRRLRRWLWLGVAVLGMAAAQTSWAGLSITTTKEYDGTGTCTLDASQNNAQVCTNDEVRYRVAYQVVPQPATQSGVTITLTIPASEPFKFSPGSAGIAACGNTGPISTDGKTLTCVLRGIAPNPVAGPIATQSGDLFFDVLTNREARNGSTLTGLQSHITSTEDTAGASSSGPGVTVIARPQVDLNKAYVGLLAGQPRPAGCTNTTETVGVTFRFRVGLNILQVKSHESLQQGWSYTENLAGMSPNACIATVLSYASQVTGGVWPTVASGNNTGLNAAGGTYTFTPGNGTQTVTSGTGANAPLTSGEVTGAIDGGQRMTAVHEVHIWVPLSEARTSTPGDACLYAGRNVISGFNPVGLSGAANVNESNVNNDAESNNAAVVSAVPLCNGSYEKLFTSNTKGGSVSLFNTPPRMSNETVGPNDYVDSYVVWTNNGVSAMRQSHCDRWDNRKMVIDLLDPALHRTGYGGTLGTGSNYRYQTVPATGFLSVADTSPAYAHIYVSTGGATDGLSRGPTNTNGEIEFGFVGGGSYTDATLRDASCNDGDSTLSGTGVPASGWITQSALKANPSLVPQINAMRMRDMVVQPGKSFQIFTHFRTLTTNPANSAVWPDGTIIPNYGSYQTDSGTSTNTPDTSNWTHSSRAHMGNDPLAVAVGTGNTAACTNPAPGAYCDDGYSDRLRLATETVGVRKGIAGTDPTGGPVADNPTVPKNKGDFVTYQLWPLLTAKSAGATIPNDLILVDTIPAGMRFVPGSLTFNGSPVAASDYFLVDNSASFGTSTLTIRVANQNAVADPNVRIPAVEFQAEILLADAANVASRQLINQVEISACRPGATVNPLSCNSQTAAQPASERRATRTINLAASGALIVQKAVIGVATKEIGSMFTMALNYLNAGSSMVPEHRLIDVLPWVGEADRGYPDLSADATAFSGTRPLAEVRTPGATGYTVYYTTAAPASIDMNPKCASNSAAPVGAWPAFASGVPPSAGCSGSATWVAATGSGGVWTGFPAGTTAILVKDTNDFPASAPPRSIEMDFSTPGSRNGDRYANNVSAAHGGPGTGLTQPGNPSTGNGPGATFNAFSNNVTVRVVAASLSGTVFVDPDYNGASGFDPANDTGLPGVTVTLTREGVPVGTAVTATADIPAGQYYNPATGAASATPGPGLCPVPAAGLAMGQYLFCDLLAGSGYQVVETQPAGYATTSNAAGSAGGTAVSSSDTTGGIALTVGQRATGYDFGEVAVTTVSGRVYVESGGAGNTADDGNGTDPGLVTTVAISCTGPAGAAPYTASTTTAADGTYSFSGIVPGAVCTITETQPVDHVNAYTQPGPSGDPSTTAPASTAGVGTKTDSTITITVPPAGSPNNNFAETFAPVPTAIPTLSQWGLMFLGLMLGGVAMRQRRRDA